MPGAFEGETVTRRRFMTLTAHGAAPSRSPRFALPALGFAAGSALFDRPPVEWAPVGPPEDFADGHVRPARHHRGRRHRRRSARPRSTSASATPTIDPPPNPPGLRRAVHRHLDALHAPRLPRPLHRGRAALRLPVPRRRLRLQRRGRRRPAGPAARPLLHPRARRPGRDRPALLGQQRVPPLPVLPRSRRRTSTASASTSTPAASPRPRWTSSAMKLPLPPASHRPPAQAQAARRGRARSSRSTRSRRPGSRPSTGSTSARRCPAAARWMMFRKVPKGTNWFYTLGLGDAVRVPLAGRDRRVPGDVLRPVGHERLRVDPPPHQRGLPRRVRARHAQVGLDASW